MEVFKFLLIIGFCTSTNGVWCRVKCTDTRDVHCGDSEYSNCTFKGLNYCVVKTQECARLERKLRRFDYIVRGNCFKKRPPCPVYKRINGPTPRPTPKPITQPTRRPKPKPRPRPRPRAVFGKSPSFVLEQPFPRVHINSAFFLENR